MAALIKQELHVDTEVEPGGRGEFSVWAGDIKVAEKTRTGFPTEEQIIASLRTALE